MLHVDGPQGQQTPAPNLLPVGPSPVSSTMDSSERAYFTEFPVFCQPKGHSLANLLLAAQNVSHAEGLPEGGMKYVWESGRRGWG